MRRATLLLALACCPRPALADGPRYDRRWVWVMSNLLVDKEADRVVDLVERAGRDGYNGLVLSDYKLNFLGRMPKSYFDHVARVSDFALTRPSTRYGTFVALPSRCSMRKTTHWGNKRNSRGIRRGSKRCSSAVALCPTIAAVLSGEPSFHC